MATDELSAEEIHKLKQFSHALPDEQDKLDQLKNADIDAIVDATGVSRRNVLQVILGLAAGGVVGGLSAQEIVQAVEADASTTDSDGNVGLPGDRVDVYADGIDATSISTGEIPNAGWVICETATEIEDAVVNASDGETIFIAPGTYQVDNPLDVTASVTIQGAGRQRTILEKTNDQPGMRVAANRVNCFDFTIFGLGSGTGTTSGFVSDASVNGDATRNHVARVGVRQAGSHGFEIHKGNLSVYMHLHSENNGDDGYNVDRPSGDNNVIQFIHPYGAGNGRHGFAHIAGYNVAVMGGYMSGNAQYGWYGNANNLWGFMLGGEGNTSQLGYLDADADRCIVWQGGPGSGTFTDAPGQNAIIKTGAPGLSHSGYVYRDATTEYANDVRVDAKNTAGNSRRVFMLNSDDDMIFGDGRVPFRVSSSTDIDAQYIQDGGGLIVPSPDGTSQYRIRVDNNGNVVTDSV